MSYEPLEITTREQWRRWLAQHHATSPGVWLITYRKADPSRHVPYEDVVQEALCFGWIDSRERKLDARRSQLLVTPRKPGSGWSRSNKQRIERLASAGLLQPSGQAVIDAAIADGSWTALDDVEALREPPDLSAALDRDPTARRHWEAFPRSAKRGILEWIASAKKPETRARRVHQTASLAAQNVRANEWRPPEGR